MKFLRDFKIGDKAQIGSHTFTAYDIRRFAQRYDPQPFHLSDEAAAKTHFKRMCASGWHTVCAWMPLMLAHRDRHTAEMQARGEEIAPNGVGAGVRDLKWLQPVYVDDIVTYVNEIVDIRASTRRRGWGLLSTHVTATNQRGERVMTFIITSMEQWAPQDLSGA